MAHLSRLAEDLVLWASDEFGLIALSSRWAEGSSIMPQKRNPDAAELTRAKAGRVFGDLQALLTALKGVPMTYGRDLQEDKEALFDATATARGALRALTVAVASLELRPERAARPRRAPGTPPPPTWPTSSPARGVPFRTAYETVKRLVTGLRRRPAPSTDLSVDDLRRYHPLFDEEALGADLASSAPSPPGRPRRHRPAARRRAPLGTPPRCRQRRGPLATWSALPAHAARPPPDRGAAGGA